MTQEGLGAVIKAIIDAAKGVPLVFALEGGYDLRGLAEGVRKTVEILLTPTPAQAPSQQKGPTQPFAASLGLQGLHAFTLGHGLFLRSWFRCWFGVVFRIGIKQTRAVIVITIIVSVCNNKKGEV